ncbi:MAG TPA: acylneuraminate cytidylyltransferase family protein, partial [Flavobacteriaceae bacterium]|nr:acylneuraminate cytidylyltransferase family protein [Flavobacteriaceae bacterium]
YADQGVIAHKRPNALATDMATTAGAIKEVVESEQKAGHTPDAIVLLQPTSPLRTAGDVLDAVHIFRKGGCKDTVVSVCEVDHPIDWVGSVDDDNKFIGVSPSYKRSQDYQKEYRLNGAVYVARADVLLNSHSLFTESLRASVMPRIRSFDIDEEVDFRLCESLIVDG